MRKLLNGNAYIIYTCPHCSALYSVTICITPPTSIKGIRCKCCGREMVDWSGTVVPVFSFIARPSNDNARHFLPNVAR